MFSWIGPPFPLLLSHFPGQCTCFRWFLPPSKDSANRKLVQSGDESCQKVTTNWCQKGAKGPKRVRWAEPLWWDRCASASHFLRPPGLRCQVFRTLWHLGTRRGSNHLAGAHNPLPSNNHLSQIHPLERLPLNCSL